MVPVHHGPDSLREHHASAAGAELTREKMRGAGLAGQDAESQTTHRVVTGAVVLRAIFKRFMVEKRNAPEGAVGTGRIELPTPTVSR